MKRLWITMLICGLLLGCASTFKMTVDSSGKIIKIESSETAVSYNPKTGSVRAIPNRWVSSSFLADILKALGL